jgi:ubiquitin-activating enzyme E1
VKKMNPETNIASSLVRVGPETESTFDVAFFEGLDGICNALDNQDARLYMDAKAVFHRIPMFDSGRLFVE